MPNIEFYVNSHEGATTVPSIDLITRVFKILEKHDMKLANETVISIHRGTYCFNKRFEPQPYIRIADTSEERMRLIVKLLSVLKIDIETQLLNGFYEKGKLPPDYH